MEATARMHVEDAVYAQLLKKIQDGDWKVTQKLPSENELCRELQVSRSSVRGAIQRLRAVGLVEVRHGKGTYVISPDEPYERFCFNRSINLTEKEFFDMTELREAIEKKAIALVAEHGREEDICHIEQAYLAMRRAAEVNDPEEYGRQDCLFHLSILAATRSNTFIQIGNIFRERYYHYFFELNKFLFEESDGNVKRLFDPGDPSDPHTMIYQYLCKRNSACAQAAMGRIFSNNKQRFLVYLKERERQQGGQA